jgi:nicotinic acid phosphoribosyltransferase
LVRLFLNDTGTAADHFDNALKVFVGNTETLQDRVRVDTGDIVELIQERLEELKNQNQNKLPGTDTYFKNPNWNYNHYRKMRQVDARSIVVCLFCLDIKKEDQGQS